MYVHLMGPEEEDRDSLLVSILGLTDLNTHTEALHEVSGRRNMRLCVYLCLCVRTLAGQ